MKGHCVPVFVSEGGIGRGAPGTQPITLLLNILGGGNGGNQYTTYQASASYVTSEGEGIVLMNSELSLFDLASGGCPRGTGMLSGGRFGATTSATYTLTDWAYMLLWDWHGVPTKPADGPDPTAPAPAAITVHASSMRGRLFKGFPAAASAAQAADSADGQKSGFVAESMPLLAVEALTEYVGRQQPLPEWADTGAIIGLQGGTSHVRHVTETLREHGVPLSALWLQDWIGARHTTLGQRLWWNWELDTQLYGEWPSLRTDFLQPRDGTPRIRLLRYVNPMFSDVVSAGRNTSDNQFQLAYDKRYLVNGLDGASPYLIKVASFDAALLDLTNPAARTWMRDHVLRQNVLGQSAGQSAGKGEGSTGAADGDGHAMTTDALATGAMSDGWMADFGEALPCTGILLHDGRNPCVVHNLIPIEWAELNREMVRNAGVEDEVLLFFRSGYTTSPGVAQLFWLGDQLHTWDQHDGLVSTVTATLAGGLSGFTLTHSDVGGYNGGALWLPQLLFGIRIVRGPELLSRWVELCAFSGAVLRTHEGLLPGKNAQVWDETALHHFRKFAKIFAAFRPYRRRLMGEAATRGWPLVRHPVLHYPTDAVLLADADEASGGSGRIYQFMLGPEWLIVPVGQPGATSVRGYVPDDEWLPLWCGPDAPSVVRGPGWQHLPAPLGRPAVYHRRDAGSAAEVRRALQAQGVLGDC